MRAKRYKTYNIEEDCCTHYIGTNTYDVGWAMLPCFKIAICRDCGTALFLGDEILAIIFEYLFAPFWDGRVYLPTKYEYGFIKQGNKLIELTKGVTNA